MTTKQKLKSGAPFIAVAAIGAAWVIMTLWPSPPPEKTSDEDPAIDQTTSIARIIPSAPEGGGQTGDGTWSTYHGDAALTGAIETVLPDSLKVLWRFQGDAAVYHTPVASDGRIFFSTSRGGVFALDLAGNEIWSKHLVREVREDGSKRMERIDAPPALFASTLLVGTLSGKLFAFDDATGEEKWVYEIGGPILGSVNSLPSEGSDRLFLISQEDGSLHCIDLATGEGIWQSESIDRCDGSPAVGNNVIVFGSCAAALHVFSTEDGRLIKNIEIDPDSQVAGGVALSGESIFSGSYSGKVIHANMRTGEIVWINEDSEDEVFTTPAVKGNWVVFASFDERVYALDRETGKQQWNFETNGLPTSPLIAGDKVLVGSDGTLFLLRLQTGEELWSYEVSDDITSPAIVSGMVLVGSQDGTVTAFGAG